MASIWDYLFQPITNNRRVYEEYWRTVRRKKTLKEKKKNDDKIIDADYEIITNDE